jgi:pilus assembly protein CpaE
MTRILIIEDEKIYQKMLAHALTPLGFALEFASNGEEGLQQARQNPPDLITCDVMMPKLGGYDVVRQLRRDARFAHVPILILTAQSDINDKLSAFEAGADDHLSKPFEPAELVARIQVLLKRFESIKTAQAQVASTRNTRQAHRVAIHSLRGGVGCSSMAINLGIALAALNLQRVLVADMVLTAGQVALMLNAPLKRTWADIAKIAADELDWEVMQSVIIRHDSGIHLIAAPTYPSEAETLHSESLRQAFALLQGNFDYIVTDLPHDFGSDTLEILDNAHEVVLLLAPELASVRAAAAALDTYRKLGYAEEKIHLVLNWTFEQKGLPRQKIEAALRHPCNLVLPFAPELFVEAINLGRPILLGRPNSKIAEAMRYFAAYLAKAQ